MNTDADHEYVSPDIGDAFLHAAALLGKLCKDIEQDTRRDGFAAAHGSMVEPKRGRRPEDSDPTGNAATVGPPSRERDAARAAGAHLFHAAEAAAAAEPARVVLEHLLAANDALAAVGYTERLAVCEHCGAKFVAERSSARFCGGRCRMAAHRKRKAAAT